VFLWESVSEGLCESFPCVEGADGNQAVIIK
jgi:hypothetical protein